MQFLLSHNISFIGVYSVGIKKVRKNMIKHRAFVTEEYWLPRGRCDSAAEAGHSVLDIQSLPWGFSEEGLGSAGQFIL